MGQLKYPESICMPFGRYYGETLGEVLRESPAYLDFLAGIEIKNADLREAIKDMCKKYEAEIAEAVGEQATLKEQTYTLTPEGGRWLLYKSPSLKYSMGENKEEAIDRAYVIAESEYAKLIVKK